MTDGLKAHGTASQCIIIVSLVSGHSALFEHVTHNEMQASFQLVISTRLPMIPIVSISKSWLIAKLLLTLSKGWIYLAKYSRQSSVCHTPDLLHGTLP